MKPITELRNTFRWTTYGKYGNSRPRTILLKRMTESHIRHCLKNPRISANTRRIFINELHYRKANNITFKDLKVHTPFTPRTDWRELVEGFRIQ